MWVKKKVNSFNWGLIIIILILIIIIITTIIQQQNFVRHPNSLIILKEIHPGSSKLSK